MSMLNAYFYIKPSSRKCENIFDDYHEIMGSYINVSNQMQFKVIS